MPPDPGQVFHSLSLGENTLLPVSSEAAMALGAQGVGVVSEL